MPAKSGVTAHVHPGLRMWRREACSSSFLTSDKPAISLIAISIKPLKDKQLTVGATVRCYRRRLVQVYDSDVLVFVVSDVHALFQLLHFRSGLADRFGWTSRYSLVSDVSGQHIALNHKIRDVGP